MGLSLSGARSIIDQMQPPVDFEILRNLLDLGGDASFLKKVITTYLYESEELLAKLKTHSQQGDSLAVARIAHALLSSSQNVGALGFAEHCRAIQDLGPQPDLRQVEPLLEKLITTFAKTRTILENVARTGNLQTS